MGNCRRSPELQRPFFSYVGLHAVVANALSGFNQCDAVGSLEELLNEIKSQKRRMSEVPIRAVCVSMYEVSENQVRNLAFYLLDLYDDCGDPKNPGRCSTSRSDSEWPLNCRGT